MNSNQGHVKHLQMGVRALCDATKIPQGIKIQQSEANPIQGNEPQRLERESMSQSIHVNILDNQKLPNE